MGDPIEEGAATSAAGDTAATSKDTSIVDINAEEPALDPTPAADSAPAAAAADSGTAPVTTQTEVAEAQAEAEEPANKVEPAEETERAESSAPRFGVAFLSDVQLFETQAEFDAHILGLAAIINQDPRRSLAARSR